MVTWKQSSPGDISTVLQQQLLEEPRNDYKNRPRAIVITNPISAITLRGRILTNLLIQEIAIEFNHK